MFRRIFSLSPASFLTVGATLLTVALLTPTSRAHAAGKAAAASSSDAEFASDSDEDTDRPNVIPEAPPRIQVLTHPSPIQIIPPTAEELANRAAAQPAAQAAPPPAPQPTAPPAVTISKPVPVLVPAPPAPLAPPSQKVTPNDQLGPALKANCEHHFPGLIQSEVRAACQAASPDFSRLGRSLVETRCRLNYGEEPRLVMACLIGVAILDDEAAGKDDFKKKLDLCNGTYPVHNEIDAFLQESCLTGIHIPDLAIYDSTKGGKQTANEMAQDSAQICAQITPERSFIGPCAVGFSLTRAESAKVAPERQTEACERYFNLNRYHKGYRACLNARAVAAQIQSNALIKPTPSKYLEVIKACSDISSELNNETERAACFVGLDIFRHLGQQEDVDRRFKKCGDNKVTYQDRDFLACLTAASLLDFTDHNGADAGCREMFKGPKNQSRSDCTGSLTLFN